MKSLFNNFSASAFAALLMSVCTGNLSAANVKVVMNATSQKMSLADKATGSIVKVGADNSKTYTFEAPAGIYVLTAYDKDSVNVHGTMEVVVDDVEEQEIKVLTCTAYASNKGWVEGTDYTVNVDVNTREGLKQTFTTGVDANRRKTFLVLNGNSYSVALIPAEARQAEGYMTIYKSGTVTYNVTASAAIPKGADYAVTVPAEADFHIGMKFVHFVPFKEVQPKSATVNGNVKELVYRLADGQQYNYRTSMSGGLTKAGYFKMSLDETKRPSLTFIERDYKAFDAKRIEHDVNWNNGYETGDILVNINERGHLRMNVGDTYDALAMRSWQLTDNQINNYFIEPDFHYTVISLDGNPSSDVISIDNADTSYSPWATIKAIGKGTAIVLVTYDAIGLNYYNNATKTPYMGGEYWGAIWPENTAAYVVTVGGNESAIQPNMVLNEVCNEGAAKNSGKYVDAEHDVFYYLDTDEGYTYNFTPSGVSEVSMAYPVIGEHSATYNGFGKEGVTHNADGSYSLLLKQGRQIVRLTDADGNSVYQVLTAKTCHRTITNSTHPESQTFQPGDEIVIQYSGLRHPANKLAGIYNMSAFVTYNNVPNGSNPILGANQYQFGSKATAQAVKITIPADFNVAETSYFVMDDGVIQINGYGDPIGNHRYINKSNGRSANFTAVLNKSYFGAIPEVRIPVTAATAVEEVNEDKSASKEVYDVLGVRRSAMQPGLNIVVCGDGTIKKIMK